MYTMIAGEKLTTKQAISQGIIQKHWQPMWRAYMWSADGCGDNLYSTSVRALHAYSIWRNLHVVTTENQLLAEHA